MEEKEKEEAFDHPRCQTGWKNLDHKAFRFYGLQRQRLLCLR